MKNGDLVGWKCAIGGPYLVDYFERDAETRGMYARLNVEISAPVLIMTSEELSAKMEDVE
jgi:hypothetical protein